MADAPCVPCGRTVQPSSTWAEIAAFVGQRSARVTSGVYTHVLLDDREVDYRVLLAEGA